jgi:hypothetical protein
VPQPPPPVSSTRLAAAACGSIDGKKILESMDKYNPFSKVRRNND